MASKPRSKSKNRSGILTCLSVSSLVFFIILIAYGLLGSEPDLKIMQTLNSWTSKTSSLATSGGNILLKMTSTAFSSDRQEGVLEENRAVVSFAGSQVHVTCPPCNFSTSTGLYNPRDAAGLRIRCLSPAPKLSILIAIYTAHNAFNHRSLLRMAYSLQSTSIATIDVVFVVGHPDTEQDALFLGLEARLFNDIVMVETSSRSLTTYHFMAKISKDAAKFRHDYVMKVEEDSYVRLANLAESLAGQPRQDLYYGYVLPCENDDAYKSYMAGMGYVVSWDLVEFVGAVNASDNGDDKVTHEDKRVGAWLDAGGRAKNRVNKKPLFYDYPGHGGPCAHDLVPDSILIHQVSTPERWSHVLSFFEPFVNLAP